MGGYSSKPKKAQNNNTANHMQITSTDRAILDLKNARDRLRRYQLQLDKDQHKLLLRAHECKKANKQSAALNILKLRQYKLREASNVDNQLLKVHEMINAVGTKLDEAVILDALRQGTSALKQLHAERSVEDVLEIMDEMQEEVDIENEICGILGTSVDDFDDVEMEAELDLLEAEMSSAKKDDNAEDVNLPEAPNTTLPDVGVAPVVASQQQQVEARVAVAS
mmetsp:Transcript_27958/g.43439  ORF Transcript_27958/g.43439 Transcript_27958/m.43439 type:complete len:223 (+) Transcript_27958:71-739(+)|eukprot:CAMPEP_0196818968 /NCGR_PEP_ID=MMETSP1362-20130617/68433_1 /TAXON_ID=163516 /ORGANISM="Leptocylindrus danicus, Strain CCMP1856" /LENGTH=222 /DNA_ID=CAMNT_0042197281 /DNA_START=60 /DNA_END=728 /DNA_ORIENTATION=+